MPIVASPERALPSERPFCFAGAALLTLLVWSGGAAGSTPSCAADRVDQNARVSHIYDGDTVRLETGDKIRFIGLNAPELGRDGKADQSLAVEARTALQTLLQEHDNRIQLRDGTQHHDKYGRRLAHGFLDNGHSIAAALLGQGLATTLVVPPNVWNLQCYAAVERAARQQRRGVWGLPRYQPLDSTRLAPDTRGYRLIRGTVVRVGEGPRNIWLNLRGAVALRIAKRDLQYFDASPLQQLTGKKILARGWLYQRKDQLRMQVRHPAALQVISDASGASLGPRN